MALQILLHRAIDLVEVGLKEEGTIMVIDVLGQLFNANATRAYIQKYSKNLLFVQGNYRDLTLYLRL